PEDALRRFRKIELDFPSDAIMPKVHIGAGTVLASTGQLNAAMEEFQRARAGGPVDATTALSRLTVLDRVYVRPPALNTFRYTAKDGMVSGRISDVISMLAPANDTVYYATKSSVATIKPPRPADAPPPALKPRGLALDRSGHTIVIEAGTLRR